MTNEQETPKEMISRLQLIVAGERDCDMSDNDIRALGWLLDAYLTLPPEVGSAPVSAQGHATGPMSPAQKADSQNCPIPSEEP